MNASEVILKLQELIDAHGDLEVLNDMNDELLAVEFSDENNDPAFVLTLGD